MRILKKENKDVIDHFRMVLSKMLGKDNNNEVYIQYEGRCKKSSLENGFSNTGNACSRMITSENFEDILSTLTEFMPERYDLIPNWIKGNFAKLMLSSVAVGGIGVIAYKVLFSKSKVIIKESSNIGNPFTPSSDLQKLLVVSDDDVKLRNSTEEVFVVNLPQESQRATSQLLGGCNVLSSDEESKLPDNMVNNFHSDSIGRSLLRKSFFTKIETKANIVFPAAVIGVAGTAVCWTLAKFCFDKGGYSNENNKECLENSYSIPIEEYHDNKETHLSGSIKDSFLGEI